MDTEAAKQALIKLNVTEVAVYDDVDRAMVRLGAIYEDGIQTLKTAVEELTDGSQPEAVELAAHYPALAFAIGYGTPQVDAAAAFGFCRNGPGLYCTTITRPDIFADYLREQIRLVMKAHDVPVLVGISPTPIPLNFATDSGGIAPEVLRLFYHPSTNDISQSDEPANGNFALALFGALRTDFSLARLRHYTGTDPTDFQNFVLLTNYDLYMNEFRNYGEDAIEQNDGYTELVLPAAIEKDSGLTWPQMPAYHLKREDRSGITIVNIGVGPSNAHNIVFNLAVLRPHAVLMVGHCGGLRPSQTIGRFVLAEGYLRDDHVLDLEVPPFVPVPPIAEINSALRRAVIDVFGLDFGRLKQYLESGTVATTANRLWEIDATRTKRFVAARALAVDMESATVATCGFLYAVPYGTLLCISDKPLYGEMKLQGAAQRFYRESVDNHLRVAIRAVEELREDPFRAHSRKLRPADAPPFR